MTNSLLLGFWNKIADFFLGALNVIPQTIYFLYATFASGIDALQLLIRKLAGLDTYYSATTGEAFNKTDPLTEFIYGILGVGESAAAYKALNTVFWSLSIFALILLVVTTMIAMIKSHYNEDSAGTNPWKFIYSGIKAILAWAIVPVVMIVGLSLSSFVLTTLDKITSITAGEEQVKEVYGTDATEIFVAETLAGTDEKSYVNYDFFGFGVATTSAPLGSMIFKAAAYSCNRVRTGESPISAYQVIQSGGKQIFGNESTCQEFSSLTSSEDKAEYVAYQIDYAFCNNLQLASSISKSSIADATGDYVIYSEIFDLFGGFGFGSISCFSKYNVSLLFFFYNLWTFNFIVAFGGGITIFGLLLSIIVGLMARLIKGAALFLVYPPLLGIAPLDNFKAFKGWVSNIVQQVMMAFGAILGMNIMLLILPYVQNIAFFNIGILDYMISVIILIVGLTMVKDFIGIVSGFAGGADALATGGGMKSDVGGSIKKGATITGKTGLNAGRTVGNVAVAPVKMARTISHNKKAKLLNEKQKMDASGQSKFYKNGAKNGGLTRTVEDSLKFAKGTGGKTNFVDAEAIKAAMKAIKDAKKDGKSEREQDALARLAIEKSLKKQKVAKKKSKYDQLLEEEGQALGKMPVANAKKMQMYSRATKLEDKLALGKLKLAKNKDGSFVTKDFNPIVKAKNIWKGDGKEIPGIKGIFQSAGKKIAEGIDGAKIGKSIADTFVKSVGSLGSATGLDKTFGGLKGIFKEGLTYAGGPYEMGKVEGDKLQSEIAKTQGEKMDAQSKQLGAVVKALGDLKGAVNAGNVFQEKTWRAISAPNTSGTGTSTDSSTKSS